MKDYAGKIKKLKAQLVIEQEQTRMNLEVKNKLCQMPGKESLDRRRNRQGRNNDPSKVALG